MKVKVSKLRENSKLPVRAHSTDAGMDLFFCPDEPGMSVVIPPSESRLLPTGLKIEVPEGYMLEIKNKSGIAAKRGLVVGACVVDRGYTGEVFVNLHNVSHEFQSINDGEKTAQAVFVKIETDIDIEECDEIYDTTTSRGGGALGSTGNF
jgi:dUTP pyrophosphatase